MILVGKTRAAKHDCFFDSFSFSSKHRLCFRKRTILSVSVLQNLVKSFLTDRRSSCIDMVIAVVAVLLGVLLGGFILIPRTRKSGQEQKVLSNDSGKKAYRNYSKAEVSLHNKRTDCWIIIKNKVYDVTSYVEEHPGGDAILAHAGDDSTEGFYGPQHATRVFDMIGDFYVGELEH